MTEKLKQEIIEVLQRSEVFVGLHDDDLTKIALLPLIRFETFEAGEIISAAGDTAENLYILVEGQVHLNLLIEFEKNNLAKEITVDTVHQGSVFGWSALVQPYAFSRTSICTEKSKVLAINGKELMGLMDSDEYIGYEVMRSIACVIASRLKTPNNYFWAELLKTRNGAIN